MEVPVIKIIFAFASPKTAPARNKLTHYMSKNTTYSTVHPGEILKDELETRGVNQKDFAATIGMPASVLNDIINGKRSVTPDIAILFEAALGKDAGSWLRLQAERDLEIARMKEDFLRKQRDIETWQAIQDCCNVKYLERYLPTGLGKNVHEKIDSVLSFFGVKNAAALKEAFIRDVNPAFFRKSDKFTNNPVNLFTWKQIAYVESAKKERPKRFSPDSLIELTEGLRTIFFENEDTIERIENLMQEYGIRFIRLDNEKGTHIDGFSFWNGANPSIALTLRYKKIDILAFTLMHEICHVFRHLNSQEKSKNCITLPDMKEGIEEQEADTFANNVLIPAKDWQLFKEKNYGESPYAIGAKLRTFAYEHQIHPAIVLGRYQHDYNIYDNGRGFDRTIN